MKTSMRTIALLLALCLLMLTGCGAKEPQEPPAPSLVVYVEPITGSAISLPGQFAGIMEAEYTTLSGDEGGMISCDYMKGEDAQARISITVMDLDTPNMDALVAYCTDYADSTFEVLQQEENTARIHERFTSSSGEAGTVYYWLYLLEDLRTLEVQFITWGDEHLPLANEISVKFGAQAGKDAPGLFDPALDTSVSYVEPLTGTLVTLPEEFAHAEKEESASDDAHSIRYFFTTAEGKEINVGIMYEAGEYANLDRLRYEMYANEYAEIITDTDNHMIVCQEEPYSEDESIYMYAWIYLLENGGLLMVAFQTEDVDMVELVMDINIAFGAKAGPESIGLMTDVQVAPGIELLPEAADLSEAPDVIVEPDTPPHNLGGWKNDNVVIFPFDTLESGYYEVIILYSRPVDEMDGADADMIVTVESGDYVNAYLAPTGPDWSNYKHYPAGTIYITEEDTALRIASQDPEIEQHLINLRSITLKKAL